MAQSAKNSTQWRSFARDFLGPNEVRYEEFEVGGLAPSGDAREGAAGGGTHGRMVDAEMLLLDKQTAREEEDQAKMAALRKKIFDFQKKQAKLAERKKERELEIARVWAEKMEQDKLMRAQERKQLLEQMRLEKEQRSKASRELPRVTLGGDQAAAYHRQSGGQHDEADYPGPGGVGEAGAHTWALTSLSSDAQAGRVSPLPAKYRDKLRIPLPDEEQCRTWKIHQPEELVPRKPRLPPEACPGASRRKKQQQQLHQKSQGEKSVVHQLPSLFPGLRRTEEGQAVLVAGEQGAAKSKNDPEESLMPKKALLRRAQLKLMRQLSDQVSFYRDHMKRNFQRILSATELEFGDVQGRRQQAAWNLAKPLTISEIKQMSAVKVG